MIDRFGKVLLYILIVIVSLFMFLPLIITIAGSFTVYWGSESFSSGWTLNWYRQVLRDYGHTITYTMVIAVSTVIINLFLGTLAAYATAAGESRFLDLLEELLSLPLAVPGIALALALVQTHAFMRVSGLLILTGHVVVTFPLIYRTVLGSLRSKNFQMLNDCAASLGAGYIYRFVHVILPNIKVTILSGAIMVFLLSLGEFNMTFFLYTPLNMTMPVGLYDSYATLRIEVGSAFTVIFLILACPLMYILHRLNQTALLRSGGV
ncbi:MAG: ABC transporter permease subunit [Clostridiaceae bacterium]|jgi:putative spermidine/putrescine transport system permease protein|nr:ABC transporter permease subunit [Clostridiaceae bacterium]